MSAYTVSQLAHNAGVSVHIVRDYLVRGLLRPVACTTGGYGVFDDAALQGPVTYTHLTVPTNRTV
ncbi:MerR family transcriptional regulator [Aeromonas caviae]|uniref:MerR family transcriptional regulator n=1 Tax=Aeromonas caviae TaxID=648 RepID=UPI003F4911A3